MPEGNNSPSTTNPIEMLETLRDRIIDLFHASELEDSTRGMWSSDAKGMYNLTANAQMLLSHGRDWDQARRMLAGASSRYEQVASELQAIIEGKRCPGKEADQLLAELKLTFAFCRADIAARIPPIPTPATSPARVVRNSAEDYVLPCSVCGKKAVAVHPAVAEEKILKGIICAGITRRVGLNVNDREKIFGWLEKGDLAALHRYMESDGHIDGGLDAYCPQCDKTYCHTHYNVKERWDEGFYDCAYGTCPQGHSREIDD